MMRIDRRELVNFVRCSGLRYWPNKNFPKDRWLKSEGNLNAIGKKWIKVTLPTEYADLGVNGIILVDQGSVIDGIGSEFSRCDWYLAAFVYLSGFCERKHEDAHGPIHSFAYRLSIPDACFDHAWANRILLLLRRLDSKHLGVEESDLFGPLPESEIRLEHDIDALDKTAPIRLKQTAFELFNFCRYVIRGKFAKAMGSGQRGLRMLLTRQSYNHLDKMAELALEYGQTATYYIHARAKSRSLKAWFFDPGYACEDERLISFVKCRSAQGFEFGLHPSYGSFDNPQLLAEERSRLESALKMPVRRVRQHWLRFAWNRTWAAQEQAGLERDATLGFNDRAGFRNSAALEYGPWHPGKGEGTGILSYPLVLMDSHFYSYNVISDEDRRKRIADLINEVRDVRGVACINWHPHTISADYRWLEGYIEVLEALADSER